MDSVLIGMMDKRAMEKPERERRNRQVEEQGVAKERGMNHKIHWN